MDTSKMWHLQRHCASTTFQLCRFAQSSAAALVEIFKPDSSSSFPRPDLKYDETITAVPRLTSSKSIATKESKARHVPHIIVEQEDGPNGGKKGLISVKSNLICKLLNHLDRSFFLSRLFNLEVHSEFDSDCKVFEIVYVLSRLVCFRFLWRRRVRSQPPLQWRRVYGRSGGSRSKSMIRW